MGDKAVDINNGNSDQRARDLVDLFALQYAPNDFYPVDLIPMNGGTDKQAGSGLAPMNHHDFHFHIAVGGHGGQRNIDGFALAGFYFYPANDNGTIFHVVVATFADSS